PAVPLADRRADDRPPDPQAARRRAVAAAVRPAAVVQRRRAPHPLRPALHRHGLPQPLLLRPAPPAPVARPARQPEQLPPAPAARPQSRYSQGHGKDCGARDRDHRCPRRPVKADELEAAVWGHVEQLLRDPATLLAQFEAFAREAEGTAADARSEEQRWAARL